MKVLLAASEVHPFAKTGGLADVAGALPAALHGRGIEVAIVLPLYPKVRRFTQAFEVVSEQVSCSFAGQDRPFRLLKTTLPGTEDIPVYLIENPWIFEVEESFYGNEPGSYGDAHLRFLYFARAILKIPRVAGFFPDVFHLNDWQTALVAPLLRTVHRRDDKLSSAATVLTIHNLAYQGVFPLSDLAHAGLPGFLLQEGRLLDDGLGNLLAGGLRFADQITTVSLSYAEEILTEEHGHGLEGLLSWRKDLLSGIVNGLDTNTWNPETDPHLPAHFSADDLSGKATCRTQLLESCGLQPTEGPVFGCVSRLASQKGLDLLPPVMEHMLHENPSIRLVLLGSGDPVLENSFRDLARRNPGRVHARLSFDAPFSSLVEAGSDLFIMPSRFEPCGLNQLISMRYGTPPIVRRVGGLKDTVTNATEETVAAGTATGITFDGATHHDLLDALQRAVKIFEHKEAYSGMQMRGMRTDWSWDKSAAAYERIYDKALEQAQDGGHLEPLLHGLPDEPLEVELPTLAHIPEGYARDILTLVPFDPRTIYCLWELGGESSSRLTDGLSHEEKSAITYELIIEETQSGHRAHYAVGGATHQWFAQVLPDASYRGELWMHRPGHQAQRVLDAPVVKMPPGVAPEL